MFTTYASRANLLVEKIKITAEEQAILDLFKESQSIELDQIPYRMANKDFQSLMQKGYVRTAGNNTVILLKKAEEKNDPIMVDSAGQYIITITFEKPISNEITHNISQDFIAPVIEAQDGEYPLPRIEVDGNKMHIIVPENVDEYEYKKILQKPIDDYVALAGYKPVNASFNKNIYEKSKPSIIALKQKQAETPTEIEMEHKKTFDKIRKDVKEDGKLDMKDKDIAKSISKDHGKELDPKNPAEGVKEYYDEKTGLPAFEKKLEKKEEKK